MGALLLLAGDFNTEFPPTHQREVDKLWFTALLEMMEGLNLLLDVSPQPHTVSPVPSGLQALIDELSLLDQTFVPNNLDFSANCCWIDALGDHA